MGRGGQEKGKGRARGGEREGKREEESWIGVFFYHCLLNRRISDLSADCKMILKFHTLPTEGFPNLQITMYVMPYSCQYPQSDLNS